MAGVSEDEDVEDSGSGTSLKATLMYGALAILLGGGSGFGLGYFTAPAPQPPAQETKTEAGADAEKAAPADAADAHADSAGHEAKADGDHSKDGESDGHGAKEGQALVTSLEPIVTNLSDPADIWIRLELVLTSKAPFEAGIADQIHQDLFAFVRAMRLSELAGPSAFINLKAELLERAKQRSQGLVEAVYVKTLLYE